MFVAALHLLFALAARGESAPEAAFLADEGLRQLAEWNRAHPETPCPAPAAARTQNLCQLSHLGKFPQFETPPSSILGIRPYSKRALAFAKDYQKISEQVHPYLGEPAVITSLAFESHVVKDVHNHLEKLETAIDMAKQLRAIGPKNPSAAVRFLRDLISLLESKEMVYATARYGLKPFLDLPVSQWGWHNLDKIIGDLEAVHENMAAMNMHIFSYMTSPTVSPLAVYFRKVAECDPKFDGYMDFPDDKNGILREAFHKFFLMSRSTDLNERRKYSYEFSILLIAHEQMYAQTYYDRIRDQHEKLAGLFKVKDPLGEYKLVPKNWADFNVRFSLHTEKKMESLTAEDILSSSAEPGTIPGYYRSRIFSPDSVKLLVAPQWPAERAPKPAEARPRETDQVAVRLLQEKGCIGCHNVDAGGNADMVGPDLSHLGAHFSKSQIREAIVNPNGEISNRCAGKRCPADIMPQDFAQQMTPAELDALVDYLSRQR